MKIRRKKGKKGKNKKEKGEKKYIGNSKFHTYKEKADRQTSPKAGAGWGGGDQIYTSMGRSCYCSTKGKPAVSCTCSTGE